jgi:uncharacterized membrane protein
MMDPPFQELVEAEKALAARLKVRRTPNPPPDDVLDAKLTFGQRVADRVAMLAGSWTFIFSFLALLVLWMVVNIWKGADAADPYPFILLNLMLSCIAALQAPVIMMSQNRQADRDRLQVKLDYEVNVRAEAEIAELKQAMDELQRRQWATLLAMQHEQLTILRRMADDWERRAANR